MPYPFGPFFKLAALTAQRREEVSEMRWEHLNLADKLWALPRELTKSDRAHEVPLSDSAVAVLETLPRQSAGFVFTTNNQTGISGFSKAKRRCDELTADQRKETDVPAILPWRIHDLRRTAASGMARLGVAPHVVEKVLNHANGEISGIGAVYNRYGFDPEK
ncbi:MAG: site-specific integrase, partial [Rhodospirillaceae bacterium]